MHTHAYIYIKSNKRNDDDKNVWKRYKQLIDDHQRETYTYIH